MTLQCYIDDSGSEPQSKYFVLAGYISKVGDWKIFTEQWGARLKSSGLEYFKMSEAMGWCGQFSKENGWDAESIKNEVDCLSKIIANNCMKSISCRIETSLFQKHVLPTPMKLPRNNTNQKPYFLLYMTLISHYWMRCEDMRIKERCDFIFDKQHGFEQRAAELFPLILEGNKAEFPNSHRSYIGAAPRWEDDKNYLPLQAADMMACLLRRFKSLGDVGRVSQTTLQHLLSIEHHAIQQPEAILVQAAHMLNKDIALLKRKNPFSKWY